MWVVWCLQVPLCWRSTTNFPAFIICCLAATLALTGCDQTMRPASPAPTAVSETLQTAAPSSEPSPAAGLKVTPATLPSPTAAPARTTGWRGLTVADEDRCSPYDPDDYRYFQSVEPRIVAEMGGIVYGSYTGRIFADRSDTDIENIVARCEAHDSGLCAADSVTRRKFSSDLTILRRPFARRSTCTRKEGAYRLWRAQWTSTSLLCSPGSKKASWAQRSLNIERRRRMPSEPELSATVRKIRGIDAHRRRAKVISFDEMWTYVGVRRGERRRSVWIWTAVVE